MKSPKNKNQSIDLQNHQTLDLPGDDAFAEPDEQTITGPKETPEESDQTLCQPGDDSSGSLPPVTPSEAAKTERVEPVSEVNEGHTDQHASSPSTGFQPEHHTLIPTNEKLHVTPPLSLHPEIEGYEIIDELGRGGMGVVYKARQQGLNRLVALKMVLSGKYADPREVKRFQAEAEVLAKLEHQNIVQIYEVGQHDGMPWFSLEYIEGGTLADKVYCDRPAPDSAAKIVLGLAEAMDQAHCQGILHRDLKPANILLAGGESASLEECTPRITDFGLAKRLEEDSGMTRNGAVMGTPSYMPPEQAEGRNWQLGPPADIYALGAILYDLLTGRPPFKGETATETLQLVLTRDPRLPSRICPDVPSDLQVICMKCLEKEPAKRYRSARDLADDLNAYLNGETIKARPASAIEKAVKWCRRRPAIAALIAVCFLSLIGFTFGAFAYAKHQREAADRELSLRQQAESAQVKAETSAKEARRQADRAEANYSQAREAVRQLTLVGHQRLKNVPHMEGVRRELLEQALKSHQQFLTINGNEPSQQSEVGRAWLRQAEIQEMLGNSKQAEQSCRKSLHVFQELCKAEPENTEHQRDLASAWNDLAILLQKAENYSEAELAFAESLKIKHELVKQNFESVQHRRELARTYHNRGHLHQMQNKPELAEKDYQSSLKLVKQSTADEVREDLARAHSDLGTVWITKEPKKALEALTQAIEQWSKLSKQSADTTHRREWAAALLNRGTLHHMKERVELAQQDYQQALEQLQKLIEEFPKTRDYRELAINGYSNRAQLHRDLERPRDAVRDWEQTFAHLQSLAKDFPEEAELQKKTGKIGNDLAIALVQANRNFEARDIWEQAIDTLQQLVKKHPEQEAYWQEYINSRVNQVSLLTAISSSKDTENACQALVESQKERLKQFPNNINYQHDLGFAWHTLAQLLQRREKHEEAIAAFEQAVTVAHAVFKKAPQAVTRKSLQLYIQSLEQALTMPEKYPSAAKTLRRAKADL